MARLNQYGELLDGSGSSPSSRPLANPRRNSPPRESRSGIVLTVMIGAVVGLFAIYNSGNQPATPSVPSSNAMQTITPTWPSDSPSLAETGYIPAISGRVQQVAVFEGNPTAPDKNARVYSNEFRAGPSAFIFIELSLAHPRRGSRQPMTIVDYVYDAAGSQLGQSRWSTYVDPEWENSYHANSLIGPTEGWRAGTYRVSLFVDGTKIAVGSFSISHQPTDAPPAERHQTVMAEIQSARELYAQRDYKGAVAACDRALQVEADNADATGLKEAIQKTMSILDRQ